MLMLGPKRGEVLSRLGLEPDVTLTKGVLCSLVAGLLLMTSGIFHTCLYVKFTPVYTETQCGKIGATMDGLTVSPQKINLGIIIEVSCVNPNPYSIEIVDKNPGKVFVGHNRQWEVGRLIVLPGSKLHEEGTGTVRVHMSAQISGPEADALARHFLEDPAVPVFMELQFSVGVSVSFGLGSWQTSAPFKKACGMNMAGLLVNQYEGSSRLGPLVCRDKFGFEIPPVGARKATHHGGQMKFAAAQVAPHEVMKGETIKNLSLGCVIAFSFLLGSFLLYGAWRSASGSPLTFSWLSPTRQLAHLGPSFEVLARVSQDVEMERGTSKVKLFRGANGEGVLPRTPKIETIRDISSPETVPKLFSPVELPSPSTQPQHGQVCEGKLGLPASPTMLSSIAGGDTPTKRSPVRWGGPQPPPQPPDSPAPPEPPRPVAAGNTGDVKLPDDEATERRVPLLTHAITARSQFGAEVGGSPSVRRLRSASRRHTTAGAPGTGPQSPSQWQGSPKSSPSYTPPAATPCRSLSPAKH